MFYVYQADVYCEKCGESIRRLLDAQGLTPEHPHNEFSLNSDDYPKGPYPYEETDTPQHCGSGSDCLDPLLLNGDKYGKLFGNPLTEVGRRYVLQRAREAPDSKILREWLECYGDDEVDGKAIVSHLEQEGDDDEGDV